MLEGRRIVVGVTGGIAAYKACELVSRLVQRGADVRVIMTRNATHLVGPATFRALTGHDVAVEMFGASVEIEIGHVSLAQWAEAICIAPATANIIGKFAAGIADDLLSTTLLAARCPIVIAPAMNHAMWESPAVQANIATLANRGVILIEPEEGWLACGEVGKGRLASVERILAGIRLALRRSHLAGRQSPLYGRRLLVTAGPTRERLDPVRFISNPSTGAMGFAIALEAQARGAAVSLVHGPTHLPPPPVDDVSEVQTAEDMLGAVLQRIDQCDIYISAAAVADFRPEQAAAEKIKKSGREGLTLKLVPTPDIITEVRKRRPDLLLVGFAAETGDLESRAREKMHAKQMDMIVANDVTKPGAGFGEGTNEVLIIDRTGRSLRAGPAPKDEIAAAILDAVEDLLSARE